MCLHKLFNFSIPTQAGQHLRLGSMQQDSIALVLSEIASQQPGVTFTIVPDNATANRLSAAVKFFVPDLTLLNFPDWETLPYDHLSPHPDIISERLATLARLPYVHKALLLVPITTLMQRLAPASYIKSTSLVISCGKKRTIDSMCRDLEQGGYYPVSQVLSHGEFAVRGSILDIFPMGNNQPYRIDFHDDEIESIRCFDPETQRSIETVTKIHLLPAHEFPLSEEAIFRFRQQWRENFIGNPLHSPLYESVSLGRVSPGIEFYLPLFFSQTQSLLDYLPSLSLILQINEVDQAADHFWKEINARYEQLRHDVRRPILPPHKLYEKANTLFTQLKAFPKISLHQQKASKNTLSDVNFLPIFTLPELTVDHQLEQPFSKLTLFIKEFTSNEKGRLLFCVESAGRREILLELLARSGIKPHRSETWKEFLESKEAIHITAVSLEEGFYLKSPPLALIAESRLFGNQVIQKRQRRTKGFDSQMVIHHLAELREGNPVVHIEHGVGRYRGLQHLKISDQENEFLVIEYANQAKLYVPVSSLNLVSRYSANDSEQAPLNHLGSDQWGKIKRKAIAQIRDIAAELLDIYAQRAAHKGYAFQSPNADYQTFSAQFHFTETPDQAQAIQHVIADMTSEKAMDRLICGDVGFGKTEVAMRAAFLAVQSNKQVAILVPTTLLAQQHYRNFNDRFAEWPIHIEMISRFRSTSEQKQILARLQLNQIDILIGTHNLLNKKLNFPRLGLLIIDEEHRFGVQQKERLKALRSEVDILSLTATPIPRTLNMALSGLRELSIIATPPARRLPIKTFIQQRDTRLIREAILRELLRGGQIYFLHNQVQSIAKIAKELEALVPEARIQVAHGQLRERELERIMADFYHQRFHVLVCTTIIETGIDVPSANTIIIDRADQFGLAQLHQLRGRVGRSCHQAYAYLMIPIKEAMTTDAIKRLEAFSTLDDLGAGLILATHDLEIRGAGELLGERQSGNIHSIGFSLYMELLEQTVKAIKSGKEPSLSNLIEQGIEINLQVSALIPETYLPDVHARLLLYKRIAHIKDEEELQTLQVEMIDRFGLFPEPIKLLFQMTELKWLAQKLGIKKIIAGSQGIQIEFSKETKINSGIIVELIQNKPSEYKLYGPFHLHFICDQTATTDRIKNTFDLLNSFLHTNKA